MAEGHQELLRQALEEVTKLPQSDRLAELATAAMLGRVGDQGTDPQPGWADELADEGEKLDRDVFKTPLGSMLDVVERSTESAEEAALASVMLALGASARLEAEPTKDDSQRKLAAKLIPQLDWMAAFWGLFPYEALAFVGKGQGATVFWKTTVETLVLDTKNGNEKEGAQEIERRLLLMVRASSLAFAPPSMKAKIAERVLGGLDSGHVRRIAVAALAGVDDADVESHGSERRDPSSRIRAAAAARAPRLSGEVERSPWGTLAMVLAAVSGVLLLRWMARLVTRHLLGYRRLGSASLSSHVLKLERKVRLLGKTIRSDEASFSVRAIRGITVEGRYRYQHLLVGCLFLVVAVALGASFLVEGTCVAHPSLLVLGLVLIAVGIGVDLAIEAWVPVSRQQCALIVELDRKQLRLKGLDESEAQDFAKALEQLLPAPKDRKSPAPSSGPKRRGAR